MKQLTKLTGALSLCSVLFGCGTSSDDLAGANEPADGQIAGDGAAGSSEEFDGRAVVIDLLEIIDLSDYLASSLIPLSEQPTAGTVSCLGGGERTIILDGSANTVVFSRCALEAGTAVFVSGAISSMTNAISSVVEFEFSQLSISTEGRSLLIGGNATSSRSATSRTLASQSLSINDSGADFLVVALDYRRDTATGIGSTGISATVNMPQSPEVVILETRETLQGSELTCPDSGAIDISVTGVGTFSLTGAEGGSLLFEQGETIDTINCTEIATLAGGTSGSTVIQPPMPPG